MGRGEWVFMGLFWVVLIAVIIWLVVRLLPSNGRGAAASQASPQPAVQELAQESPVELLDRRFAKGELDLETYQNHRAALLAARGGAK